MNTDLLTKLKTDFTDISERFLQAKLEYQTVSRSYLMEYVKVFMDACPEVKTIRWVQYTPYFNDGDECYFGVQEPYFSNIEDTDKLISFGEEIEDSEENEWCVSAPYSNNTWYGMSEHLHYLRDPIVGFKEMLESISDESMKEIFGDHAQITITKNGINIDEYSHD